MIKWGIIGAGNIANRFAKSLAHVEQTELYAVACRTMVKAERFQQDHPCPKAYDDYQALLDDPNVDAVYIAVPHGYHFQWVTQALKAGKAVLCEKPAVLTLEDMQQISQLARAKQLFFMEAMKSRFVPAYRDLKKQIEHGVIGEIQQVETSLCRIFSEEGSSYHFQPVQGGPLLDMGVYNLSVLEDFMESPFTIDDLDYRLHPNGIEVYVKATLSSNSIQGIVETAFDVETETVAWIKGTKGTIRIPDFHRATSYDLIQEDATKTFEVPYEHDDFYSEIAHFVECLQNGKTESPLMSLQHSENIARMMDQIKANVPVEQGKK